MIQNNVHHALTNRILLVVADRSDKGSDRLPPERELAAQLGVARGTLRKALAELEESGVLMRRPGRTGGIFIRDAHPFLQLEGLQSDSGALVRRTLNRIQGVPSLLVEQGMVPSTRVIRTERRHARPDEGERLGISSGDEVFDVLRLRLADEIPLSLESMVLPDARFPGLLNRSLDSMYELLEEEFGVAVASATEQITVVRSSAAISRLLRMGVGEPLFRIQRTAFDGKGVPIECSDDLFDARLTTLTVDV